MRRGAIHVGTSGWNYGSWKEHLYRGVPRRRWLAHAAATFGALEINGSFYVQIARSTYRRWRDEAPEGTHFALKGHRFVTHDKRLRDVSVFLDNDAEGAAVHDALALQELLDLEGPAGHAAPARTRPAGIR